MSRLPVVAVLGRPNVGKSTLVNRILRRRAAVVEEKPGVTRDRKTFEAEWAGRHFLLVDTGGWAVGDEELTTGIRQQAEAALSAADAVVFVTDATTHPTQDDEAVARLVQESGIPHLLVANKIDGPKQDADAADLWSLGLGEPLPVSALNGRNTGDLLDSIIAALPDLGEAEPAGAIPTLAILGRPNVGKSTLLNQLLGEERVLVSPVPGTTRDPIAAVVELDGEPFRVYDTAGMRRAARVSESTEFYSVLRAREALAEADVALLMIDSTEGVTHQEQRLAEEIVAAGTGLIVLLNKWDDVDGPCGQAGPGVAAEPHPHPRIEPANPGLAGSSPAPHPQGPQGPGPLRRPGRIRAAHDHPVREGRRSGTRLPPVPRGPNPGYLRVHRQPDQAGDSPPPLVLGTRLTGRRRRSAG
jgi:GTP-binding protein